MATSAFIRRHIKRARARGAWWVSLVDLLRLLPSAEGRARLWTRFAHGHEVHQTSPDTCEERYPKLFDLAARLMPNASRILSFGCSTGEEILSLRRRFPSAEIIGAEINPRSRRIARQRLADDALSLVVSPKKLQGTFDIIFALSVLQREPHKIIEMDVENLTPFYPFARFDAAVSKLILHLRTGGIFCLDNAQYRVEDSAVAGQLSPVTKAPSMQARQFGRDGRRSEEPHACAMFRKILGPSI